MPELTSTAACVLGLLALGPPPPASRDAGDAMTGWQVNETAKASLGRFWTITRSQIYLELSRLEEAGLVKSTGSDGPRARRPYRVTEAGRSAFQAWLEAWARAGPRPDQLRSPMLLTVFFGSFLDRGIVENLLVEYRLSHQRALESRLELLAGLSPEQAASLPGATLDRGIASLRMTLDWLDRTIARLEDRGSRGP